ncbi:MAG: hypothetical protein AAF739_17635 [Pseudomonadota bacterium]
MFHEHTSETSITLLKGVTWDHPRAYSSLVAASTEYARNNGVVVQWERRSLQAFADAPIDELARNYDLIVLDHPHVGQIAETGSLAALPKPNDATLSSLGGSLESYIWNNKLWALPIDGACQMAASREDLSPRPLPSWDKVFSASPRGFRLITPLLPIDAFDMMLTLVASMGEIDLPKSDTEFISKANGLVALGILKALYKLGPADAINWNPIDVLELMATTDEFAYAPCLFGYINYARPGFRAHALTFGELPIARQGFPVRGILGGAGLGVSSQSYQQSAAKAFAAWVASRAVQSGIYIDNDGQPAHRAAWLENKNHPAFRGFLNGGFPAMENAWTRPRDPWFLEFVDDVCDLFPDFFLKDQALQHMLDAINALYRKHHKQDAYA